MSTFSNIHRAKPVAVLQMKEDSQCSVNFCHIAVPFSRDLDFRSTWPAESEAVKSRRRTSIGMKNSRQFQERILKKFFFGIHGPRNCSIRSENYKKQKSLFDKIQKSY